MSVRWELNERARRNTCPHLMNTLLQAIIPLNIPERFSRRQTLDHPPYPLLHSKITLILQSLWHFFYYSFFSFCDSSSLSDFPFELECSPHWQGSYRTLLKCTQAYSTAVAFHEMLASDLAVTRNMPLIGLICVLPGRSSFVFSVTVTSRVTRGLSHTWRDVSHDDMSRYSSFFHSGLVIFRLRKATMNAKTAEK